jgi:hypothetical protein
LDGFGTIVNPISNAITQKVLKIGTDIDNHQNGKGNKIGMMKMRN